MAALALSLIRVDAPVVVSGRIVSLARVQDVRAAGPGTVGRLSVQVGDSVRAGDPLIEWGPAPSAASANDAAAALEAARLEEARSDALLAALQLGTPPELRALPRVDPTRLRTEERLMRAQYDELRSRIAAIEGQTNRVQADQTTERDALARLEQAHPALRQRADEARALFEKGFISKNAFLEREQRQLDQDREIDQRRVRLAEMDGALGRAAREKDAIAESLKRQVTAERAEAARRIALLERESGREIERGGTTTEPVRAPIEGTIQSIVVRAGAISADQVLLTLLPAGAAAIAEARMEASQAGRIAIGQRAAVSVEGQAGEVAARIESIALDGAVARVRLALDPAGRALGVREGAVIKASIAAGSQTLIERFIAR